MSTWTDQRHEQVRRRLNAADGALHLGWDDGLDGPMQEVVANAYADLSDALDEIARLRAESARRMVWLETVQRALELANAALIDMTERAAKPDVTDQMVEAAADAIFGHLEGQGGWNNVSGDAEFATLEGLFHLRPAARAALEAAPNPKENEA